MLAHFKLESVCAPGNTLLWDLLQDDKIGQLSEGLVGEAEKSLVALLCFNMERFIRYVREAVAAQGTQYYSLHWVLRL